MRAAHNMRSCREPVGAELKHSIISSLIMFRSLGLSALGSPHTVKRFIDLAIVARTRSRDLRSLVHESHRMSLRQFILAVIGMSLRQVILAVIVGVLLAVLVLWLAPELVRKTMTGSGR